MGASGARVGNGKKSDIFKHVTFMSSSECQIEKERGRIHVDLMTVSSLGKYKGVIYHC